MNFHSSIALSEGSCGGLDGRKPFVGFSPSAGAAPCADCIGYPLKTLNWNDERKEARHTSRVPILTSRSSPAER